MMFLTHGPIADLVATYGYWLIAGIVALESTGLPVPGEAALIAGAVLAGTSAQLQIEFVIAAAAAGAVLGDNLGFLIGRQYGYGILVRYGRYVHLNERRLKLGHYLFHRHGAKVVFFGRFVTLLRILAALLAGANRMAWRRFAVANVCGGVLWATAYGSAGWAFGQALDRYRGPIAAVTASGAVAALALGWWYVRRHEARLQAAAERAMPGPLSPLEGLRKNRP
ncbi:DedA family protein [Azospirillum melinis]